MIRRSGGRFNEGEKFVLSLCEVALISTTTGTVTFGVDGRKLSKKKTAKGSIFNALIKVSRSEITEMLREVRKIIVPDGFTVKVNGEEISQRSHLRSVGATLQTITADEEGCLKRTNRATNVTLHPTLDGEGCLPLRDGHPCCQHRHSLACERGPEGSAESRSGQRDSGLPA